MIEEFNVIVPPNRYEQSLNASKLISMKDDCPFHDGVHTVSKNHEFRDYMRGTWMPALTVVGMTGIPSVETGGNVLHPKLSIKKKLKH